jgi:hypothetical protein
VVAINGLPDRGDECFHLGMVVIRDHRARRSALRLVGHEDEGGQQASLAAATTDEDDRSPSVTIAPWPT